MSWLKDPSRINRNKIVAIRLTLQEYNTLKSCIGDVSVSDYIRNQLLNNKLACGSSSPSKNRSCPCGSGRKYKHCCMRD